MSAEPPIQPTALAHAIGGVRGAIDAGLPAVLFVLVATLTTLRTAVVAALTLAALIFLVRLVRREPARYALNGVAGVAVSAFIALRIGRTEGFFLPGIVVNAVYAVVFAGSVAVRRPLVGVLVKALGRPEPTGGSATWTTLLWAGVFASRALVQGALYAAGHAGWLAVVKLAMGWPLTLGALAVTMATVRRQERRVATETS